MLPFLRPGSHLEHRLPGVAALALTRAHCSTNRGGAPKVRCILGAARGYETWWSWPI